MKMCHVCYYNNSDATLPFLPMTQKNINKLSLKKMLRTQADLLAGQLTDITLTAGWDFHFLKVLLAGSEERVFFPRNVK